MIESGELIERWINVDRVLDAMPEHERQHHWDMGTWGTVNNCGTIACAAGHCGLDPWFRARGFELNFRGTDVSISNVERFFGAEGAQRIFLNTTRRPVSTVVEEVQAYVGELRTLVALASAPGLPKIGELWAEQGGVFAGARLGVDGAPNYFLILGPEYDGLIDWYRAEPWARALVADGHRDFTLPDRAEYRTLFDRVRDLFQETAYWSSEQHASGSGRAWGQYFDDGRQNYWIKGIKLRARAVRRLVIQ